MVVKIKKKQYPRKSTLDKPKQLVRYSIQRILVFQWTDSIKPREGIYGLNGFVTDPTEVSSIHHKYTTYAYITTYITSKVKKKKKKQKQEKR